MEIYTLIKYFRYSLFSRHRSGHGIHSPFVFDLIEKVMRNKSVPTVVLDIEERRKALLRDKRLISVKDLGSGSKRMKGSLRKISDIAKFSSIPSKYGRLLANMSATFGDGGVLELGTSLGISTMYLASGQKEGRVYTVEGCPETLAAAQENFELCGFERIKSVNGSFDDIIPQYAMENRTVGLVYIDGDHRKESVVRYYEKIKDFADERSVVIIDDIYSSEEMGEAWEVIKKDKRISITIDIYRFGIVFYRSGLTRTDYVIRY